MMDDFQFLYGNKTKTDLTACAASELFSSGFDSSVNIGDWDASSNEPELADGTGTDGNYYTVIVGGTQDLGSGDIIFGIGNIVKYDGTTKKWILSALGNSSAVFTVNGLTGNVELDTDDIIEGIVNKYCNITNFNLLWDTKDTDDLPEGSSNLYWTNTRFDTRFDTRFTAKSTDDLSEGTSNLYWTSARFDTSVAGIDSDDISEGTTNLYYTDGRVGTYIGTITSDDISEGSTNLYYTDGRDTSNFNTNFTAKDTDNLSEGSTNLYWTQARFNTAVAATNTDSLSEGTSNLYYTDGRVSTYIGTTDTDSLSEGSINLYYTNVRADARIVNATDDTAGSGDTDKLWSADQIYDELGTRDTNLSTLEAKVVTSEADSGTGALRITNMVQVTQAQYDALTPNSTTMYVIVG